MQILDKERYIKMKFRLSELEITQKELAKRLNCSQQLISQIMRGLNNSERIMEELEKVLKIELKKKPTEKI